MKPADEISAIRKRLKKLLGLKQREVATLLDISPRTLMRWEKGRTVPRTGDLDRARGLVAAALKKKRGV